MHVKSNSDSLCAWYLVLPLCLSDQGMVCLAIACIDARSNPLYVALFITTSTRGEKRMLANDDHYPPP